MGRLLLNWDDSCLAFFLYRGYASDAKTAEDYRRAFRAAVRQYVGTGLTDLIMTMNARLSSFPSKSWQSYCEKYHQKTENGHPVDWSDTWVRSYSLLFEKMSVDPFETMLAEAEKLGIRRWISIRMNDAHETFSETSMLSPDYYHEHPEFRRYTHRDDPNYYARIFDYAHPEVRERILAYIEESLARYDVEGLELDWMREYLCFAPGGEYEGIAVLNDFMRRVRKIADRYSKERGSHIAVSVRLPASPETALYAGFDAGLWAQEGLIDWVIPTSRWATTDTDMPIELWKRLLSPYHVRVAAGVEIIMWEYPDAPFTYNTVETVTAAAASYWSAGADGMYLFNYMHAPGLCNAEGKDISRNPLTDDNYREMLSIIGDSAAAVHAPRRHMLSFRDLIPFWEDSRAQLPAVMDGTFRYFRIRTGVIPQNAKVRLIIGLEAEENLQADDFKGFINTHPLQYIGKADESSLAGGFAGILYAFAINAADIQTQAHTVELSLTHGKLVHLELDVNLN